MEVELRLFATVRAAVGERTLTREYETGTTVRAVLADLEAEYPELAGRLLAEGGESAVADSVTVMRNGTHVTHFAGGETVLEAGDRLSVTPPVSGG